MKLALFKFINSPEPKTDAKKPAEVKKKPVPPVSTDNYPPRHLIYVTPERPARKNKESQQLKDTSPSF